MKTLTTKYNKGYELALQVDDEILQELITVVEGIEEIYGRQLIDTEFAMFEHGFAKGMKFAQTYYN